MVIINFSILSWIDSVLKSNIGIFSLIGVILGLLFMMYFAYKGFSVIVLSIVASIIVIIFSRVSLAETLTGPYMKGFSGFAAKYWLIFLFSAIFGQYMSESGAAKTIAYKFAKLARMFPGKEKFLAVMVLVIINGFLTYGGISLFVVVFTMVAIAKELFQELDIPWSMYTCSPLASGVITMTMLPGSPSIQNIIPTKYLGTTAMAAPKLGIILALVALTLGCSYILYKLKSAERREEGFLPSGKDILGVATEEKFVSESSLIPCLIPSGILLISMNYFKLDPSISLALAIITCYIIFFKKFSNVKETLKNGCTNSLGAIGGVCAVIGFGTVVSSVPAFSLVMGALDKIPGPPIVQLILAVNIAAGVTGSASGGLGIALETLAPKFLAMNIPPEVIHRIATVSCGGLDSLPHNGAVVNTLSVTKLNYKNAYGNYFVITVIIPLICCILGAFLYTIGIY